MHPCIPPPRRRTPQELLPWLRRGFDASVLLLQGQGCLDAATLASRVGAAAFANGGSRLGVTWQLLSGGSVRGPLGAKVRPPGAPAAGKRPAAASSRPGSRLGRDSAAAAGDEEQQRQQECTTFCATSAAELQHALGAARQQLQHAAAAAGEGPPPVLLLRLELRSPAGARPQKAAALHVLQCACPGSVAGQEAQGAPQLLLKLLEEVADLHRRRREGEPGMRLRAPPEG